MTLGGSAQLHGALMILGCFPFVVPDFIGHAWPDLAVNPTRAFNDFQSIFLRLFLIVLGQV